MKAKNNFRTANSFFPLREKNKINNFRLYSSNLESSQSFKPRSFATAECLEFRKENNLDYGKFYLSGLKKGQGLTVANSIRRILLYDLQGIGITHVKVSAKNSSKVYHEFATIPGIRESILDFLMNLRLVVWGLKAENTKTIPSRKASISKYYKGELFLQNLFESDFSQNEKNESKSEQNRETQKTFILRAKHLNIPQNSSLFIVNPEQYLATIVFKDIAILSKADRTGSSEAPLFSTEEFNQLNELNSIKIEYVITNLVNKLLTPSEEASQKNLPLFPVVLDQIGENSARVQETEKMKSKSEDFSDFLLTDGNFFPIKKVNYSIQEDQQGERSLRHQENLTDENVFLEIWTNGSFHPKDALSQALDYFLILFQELKTSLVSF